MKNSVLITVTFVVFAVNAGITTGLAQKKQMIRSSTNSLETLVIKDSGRNMDEADRKRVVTTVTNSFIASARSNGPKYVSPKLPVIQLLEFSYPKLREYEEERGIAIRNVVRVLNSDPANRSIIDQVLTAQDVRVCH